MTIAPIIGIAIAPIIGHILREINILPVICRPTSRPKEDNLRTERWYFVGIYERGMDGRAMQNIYGFTPAQKISSKFDQK